MQNVDSQNIWERSNIARLLLPVVVRRPFGRCTMNETRRVRMPLKQLEHTDVHWWTHPWGRGPTDKCMGAEDRRHPFFENTSFVLVHSGLWTALQKQKYVGYKLHPAQKRGEQHCLIIVALRKRVWNATSGKSSRRSWQKPLPLSYDLSILEYTHVLPYRKLSASAMQRPKSRNCEREFESPVQQDDHANTGPRIPKKHATVVHKQSACELAAVVWRRCDSQVHVNTHVDAKRTKYACIISGLMLHASGCEFALILQQDGHANTDQQKRLMRKNASL